MQGAPSPASVQAFAARALPPLIKGMAERRGLVSAAQALGASLAGDLCLPAVEISMLRAGREGIIFRGQTPGDSAVHSTIESPTGGLTLSVGFEDADHQTWLLPVLRSVLALLDLAPAHARPRAADQDRSWRPAGAFGQSPAEPAPRTLDPAVAEIYHQARRIASGDIGVLIRGPSGSGKEVLASFVHRASPLEGGAFLALNCAALSRDLVETELFGVERGVATGVDQRPGMFERAHGGTLFLDEVGDMDPATQSRILRVMQEGEVARIGGSTLRPARARILAATNRDLDKMIETGAFRRDLFHRLSGWEVRLPPLAERRADIVNLAVFFLDREMSRFGLTCRGLSPEVAARLESEPWPGNVRQLERWMVRAALFLEDGERLEMSRLPAPAAEDDHAPEGLDAFIRQVERRAIDDALRQSAGDVEAAAQRLGVGRSTLYRRLKHLDMDIAALEAGASAAPESAAASNREGDP